MNFYINYKLILLVFLLTLAACTEAKSKYPKSSMVQASSLDMLMDVELLEGNSLIEEVRNQAAVKRGPIVYCAWSNKGQSEMTVFMPVIW
jgi:hypothetical protein